MSREGDSDPGRRRALKTVGALAAAMTGAVLGLPVISLLVAPIFQSPPRRWRRVGEVDAFPVGATRLVAFADARSENWAGAAAKTGAWLRRLSSQEFVAFAINCTHLGCPVRWEEGPKLFMCPCHGGVYHGDGTVAAGPPPEPLKRYSVRVRNGHVELETGPLPIA
jgi:menaquinol-cytochrome c reductase iron-sulfur subunit